MQTRRQQKRDGKKLHKYAEKTSKLIVKDLRDNQLLKDIGVQFLKRGDRLFAKKDVQGLRAFWISRGGYIEASELREHVLEAPRDIVGFHVSEYEEKLHDASFWQELRKMGSERLSTEIALRAQRLCEANPNKDAELTFGIWIDEFAHKAFREEDNWCFHYLVRVYVGGIVV